jgi:hypothetical protein
MAGAALSLEGPEKEILQAISKPQLLGYCHSERSEESRIFNWLRSFTPFRMTEKTGFEVVSIV